MPSRQRKRESVMVEIIPIRIQPIMAIQACHSKSNSMVEHERLVRLFVTVAAHGYVEGGDILSMTIAT